MTTPQWVIDLAEKHGGSQFRFMMEKTIEKSDLDKQQNRLRIPKQCIMCCIVPMLRNFERDAANLVGIDPPPRKMMKMGIDDVKNKKEAGRVHRVLPIEIYDRAGWRFRSSLVRWDSSSTVLRGGEWMTFACWNGFKVGDKIEMWVFRGGEGHRLCFVITKKVES